MKGVRILRRGGSVLTPRTRPTCAFRPCFSPFRDARRTQATAAAPIDAADDGADSTFDTQLSEDFLTRLPSPPVTAAKTSAKLSALHARLGLPSRIPLETLARALVDASADPSTKFNNKAFSVLGNDLLSYYTSEYIICQYPRLPLSVVFAAMYSYGGPKTLTAITREWGVERAAAPGGEVDPGLLQFKMLPPEAQSTSSPTTAGPKPEMVISPKPAPGATEQRRRSISSRVIYDDEFGDLIPKKPSLASKKASVPAGQGGAQGEEAKGVTLETASSNFVRAVMGAVYLHAGRAAAKNFYREHFMSRQLNMANLFQFRTPTRDLSRLCSREGFQPPVARILSETGRKSRHPVFVVGVFSGEDKLGEGAGSSLDEARTRASVAALKGWYLYSPLEWRLPSETEETGARPWTPMLVDAGDILA